MACETSGAGIFWIHDAHNRVSVQHRHLRIPLSLCLPWIGKHTKDLRLKVIGLIPRETEVDAYQIDFDSGYREELLSRLSDKHRRNEPLKAIPCLLMIGCASSTA